MEGIPGIRFPELNETDTETQRLIKGIADEAKQEGILSTYEVEAAFTNKDFFDGLPESIKSNRELLAGYIKNSSRFNAFVHNARKERFSGKTGGFLTQSVHATESSHADGRKRRDEEGHALNVEYLRSQGIDPSKVLFYRRTQPSESPALELYWTSDFREVAGGLTVEISGNRRDTSIVLVSDLEMLDSLSGGLMQDINDDGGISIRFIHPKPVDQKNVLFSLQKLDLLKN